MLTATGAGYVEDNDEYVGSHGDVDARFAITNAYLYYKKVLLAQNYDYLTT